MRIPKQKEVTSTFPACSQLYRQTPCQRLPADSIQHGTEHRIPRQTREHHSEDGLDLITGASHARFEESQCFG